MKPHQRCDVALFVLQSATAVRCGTSAEAHAWPPATIRARSATIPASPSASAPVTTCGRTGSVCPYRPVRPHVRHTFGQPIIIVYVVYMYMCMYVCMYVYTVCSCL